MRMSIERIRELEQASEGMRDRAYAEIEAERMAAGNDRDSYTKGIDWGKLDRETVMEMTRLNNHFARIARLLDLQK